MKLCIPTMTNQRMEAEICGHFGSAPWFAFYDQQTQTVEYLANHKAEHEHGQCRPMDLLAKRGLGAVLCKGMGKSAIATVERQGIKVFATSGATVREAIDEFMSGRLVKLDAETGCKGHACH
jgi:predicted Fe-Mo cluster-binding NifX family protein